MEDNFVRKYGDPEAALAASKNVIKVGSRLLALPHECADVAFSLLPLLQKSVEGVWPPLQASADVVSLLPAVL